MREQLAAVLGVQPALRGGQLPRGVLDPQEETVTVKYDVEGRSLTVEVLAAAGAERYRWLRFRAVERYEHAANERHAMRGSDPQLLGWV